MDPAPSSLRLIVLLLALVLAPTAGADPVRVLTWNLGLLDPLGVSLVPDVAGRLERLPEELALRASGADLVVLQEVWRTGQADRLAAAFPAEEWTLVVPGRPGILGLGSGLLAAVRQPWAVQNRLFDPLKWNWGAEGWARKGVLALRISGPGGSFVAVVYHLGAVDKAVGPTGAGWLSQLAQAEQVGRELGAGELPSVWIGDANAGPERLPELFAALKAAAGAPEPPAPGPTWDPANPTVAGGLFPHEIPAVLDHIVFSPGWTETAPRRVLISALSDHHALAAEAELQGLPVQR